MHSITELKNLFEKKKIRTKSFDGVSVTTKHGRWSMAHDEYYLKGEVKSRADIKKLAK